VLGRALCSLGEWDSACVEIESVKDDVPTIQVGMALAPLVVIALARGQRDRAAQLTAEHDRRCQEAGANLFEADFRSLRRLVLATDAGELARIVPEAAIAEFAEWSGWLAPVIDRLVAAHDAKPLAAALAALRSPDAMKQMPPVRVQAERLAGHLAARDGDCAGAEHALARAAELAHGCELRFEAAVIALERHELTGTDLDDRARETFVLLRAAPWLERLTTRVSC
jgi:hypothetical protein